jgi:AcrR family transcriptional regulator
VTTARDALLGRIIDDVAANGLGDRSLRDLAAAVGTSHRLLLYHFSSRSGLVAAIVEQVEATQRASFAALVTRTGSSAALIRALWKQVSADDSLPFVRLFFELSRYVDSDVGTVALTAPWLADTKVMTRRLGVAFDAVQVRLGIAVVRGLLLDVLAGERRQATAALERFIATTWPDDELRPSPVRVKRSVRVPASKSN